MAKMSGVPSPPLRMIAPNGAPIRKRIIQANESVILRCHSIECLRMDLDLSSNTERSDSALILMEDAVLFVAELQLIKAVSGNS